MAAGVARLLASASGTALIAAVLTTPASAAPLLPGVLRSVTPNALTVRFQRCMTVTPRTAPGRTVPATPPANVRGAVAGAPAAKPVIPSAAECLAELGLAGQPSLREFTALCLGQRGVAQTICLNRVFAPYLPPVRGTIAPATPTPSPEPTPTPTPTATPTPTPTATPTPLPTRHPTPRPTRKPTPKPTRKPTAPPTATPVPRPTATPTPRATATPTRRPTATPTREPTERPTRKPTPAPRASATTAVLANLPTSSPAPAPTPTPIPSPSTTPTTRVFYPVLIPVTTLALGGAGIGLAALAVLILIRTRRARKGRPQMHRLTLAAPADGSIAVAGTPVTFTAQTDPPNLATKITWSVTTQPNVHGIGPAFTHTFAATGVEQVVARLGDDALACDVIVYVFKTPSGGSTLTDVLHAEPPPVARSAGAFTRYGTSASAPGKAS